VAAATPDSPPDRNSLETKVVQQRPSTQTDQMASGQSNEPRLKTTPRSDPRLRRVSSSAHGKASPYLSSTVRKPSTPPQARAGQNRADACESRPKQAFSSAENGQAESSLGSSSGSATDANNQADSQALSAPPQVPIPILRQGHKGLKDLKKFRAASPYSNAVPRKEKRTVLQQPRREVPIGRNADTSNAESDRSTASIGNSVRDIGLELSVYKFRYVASAV
jgi:hypothetical protein